jgi:mannose-1-phosphate guanylyltransferase / mannose-6-phosphate isomerase
VTKIQPIILCGGSGTRLWPLSRQSYPKQFLKLHGNYSLFQQSLKRIMNNKQYFPPTIICNYEQRFIVAEQCRKIELKGFDIIVEPYSKNTAIAISVGVEFVRSKNGCENILVLPSDQIIENDRSFNQTLSHVSDKLQKNSIVCFGINPDHPSSEYGYIKAAEKDSNGPFLPVERFIEKPSQKEALELLKLENIFWNCGIFLFSRNFYGEQLALHSPDIDKAAKLSIKNSLLDLDFVRLPEKYYLNIESISIDYALMEKCKQLALVPMECGWRDLGSWASLAKVSLKNKEGNTFIGDVVASDITNSYVNNNNNKLVAILGLKDLILVNTPDALFVASKEKANDVKIILEKLEASNRGEQNINRKEYRPWGWYDTIEVGDFFKVKRLYVNSKSKLSYQSHEKRAEHWTVVKGVATIERDGENFELNAGESIFIPKKSKHSLANKRLDGLEVVEVQSGSYLGEDDIVRYEDIYGRLKEVNQNREKI